MPLTDYRPDAMRCTRCSYCKWIPFDLVRSHRFAKGCPSIEAGKFHAYSAGVFGPVPARAARVRSMSGR